MTRDIRYLVAIISVIRACHINSSLVGVVEARAQDEPQGEIERHIRLGVQSVDLHRTEVKHRPPELLALGVRNDLIRDAVVVIGEACRYFIAAGS